MKGKIGCLLLSGGLVAGVGMYCSVAGKRPPVLRLDIKAQDGPEGAAAPRQWMRVRAFCESPIGLAGASDETIKAWQAKYMNPDMEWRMEPASDWVPVDNHRGGFQFLAPSAPGSYRLLGRLKDTRMESTFAFQVAASSGSLGVAPGLTTFEARDEGTSHWVEPVPIQREGFRGATLTRLQDGTFLIAGGRSKEYLAQSTAFRYDLAKGKVTQLQLAQARFDHQALLLPDGRVALGGGLASRDPEHGAAPDLEIFDPKGNRISSIRTPWEASEPFAIALDPQGRIVGLSMGFLNRKGPSCHRYDFKTGAWTRITGMASTIPGTGWEVGGAFGAPWLCALGGGGFLGVAGNQAPPGYSTYLYVEPDSGKMFGVADPVDAFKQTLVKPLPGGSVLVLGSRSGGNAQNTTVEPLAFTFDGISARFAPQSLPAFDASRPTAYCDLPDGDGLGCSATSNEWVFWRRMGQGGTIQVLVRVNRATHPFGVPVAMSAIDRTHVLVLGSTGAGVFQL